MNKKIAVLIASVVTFVFLLFLWGALDNSYDAGLDSLFCILLSPAPIYLFYVFVVDKYIK